VASLQLEQFGHFHIVFRINGKRYKRSLNTKSEAEALSRKETIEETLLLVGKGRLSIPARVNAADFILADGKIEASEPADEDERTNGTPPPSLTLQALFKQFFEAIPDGNLEETTLGGMHGHEKHFLRIFKPSFPIQSLATSDLQRYVNRRAKEKTQFLADTPNGKRKHRTNVTAGTIKKELVTLGTVWRWAEGTLVNGPFRRHPVSG
jgi:hypothetical protein